MQAPRSLEFRSQSLGAKDVLRADFGAITVLLQLIYMKCCVTRTGAGVLRSPLEKWMETVIKPSIAHDCETLELPACDFDA